MHTYTYIYAHISEFDRRKSNHGNQRILALIFGRDGPERLRKDGSPTLVSVELTDMFDSIVLDIFAAAVAALFSAAAAGADINLVGMVAKNACNSEFRSSFDSNEAGACSASNCNLIKRFKSSRLIRPMPTAFTTKGFKLKRSDLCSRRPTSTLWIYTYESALEVPGGSLEGPWITKCFVFQGI